MNEDFLHHIWKYKKIDVLNLKTVNGAQITILAVGQHNLNAGPDFFNSQLKIGEQIWAGNVEIHVNASDWFVHHHETDKAYDNVILHVVWEHDTDIFRKNNTRIPTLELKNFVSHNASQSYHKLFSKKQKWINCEHDFAEVDDFIIENWLERLFFERLERKSHEIEGLLTQSSNNWEAVLFKLLAKNFGLKINGESFISLANSFEFSILRKTQSKLLSLEALFYGQCGLLEREDQAQYVRELQNEYQFLSCKYGLSNEGVIPLQFFRLRPSNFPTIRLAQLARLYYDNHNLFSKVVAAKTLEQLYQLFSVATSLFWETHYTFNNVSKKSNKATTREFIELLIINTIIPLKFSFAKHQGVLINDKLIFVMRQLASEKNSIISAFNSMKNISKSAFQSQALLQLKNEYCNKNKCLSCRVGYALIT